MGAKGPPKQSVTRVAPSRRDPALQRVPRETRDPIVIALAMALREVAERRAIERAERRSTMTVVDGEASGRRAKITPMSTSDTPAPEPYVRRALPSATLWHDATRVLADGSAVIRCQRAPLRKPLEWRTIPPYESIEAEGCPRCLTAALQADEPSPGHAIVLGD